MKIWKSTIIVRSYELDSFGHVNNGTYPNYLEAARCDYLKEANIHFKDFDKWKKFPVIAKVMVEYKSPAYYMEVLHIDAIVKDLGKSSFIYEYKITKEDGTLVANAETLMVFVNEKGRPCYMPEEVRAAFAPE